VIGKRYLSFAALAAIVVLLLLPLPASRWLKLRSRDSLAPFHNGLSILCEKGREVAALRVESRRVAEEKRTLREKIGRLEYRLERMRQLEEENERLRERLAFGESGRHRLTFCRVVARGDGTGWWQTLRLNRGRADGIRPDMPVVVPEGLVGRVMDAATDTCDVLLVTDPAFRVSCRLSRTGGIGVLKGTGVPLAGDPELQMLAAVPPCRVDYLDKDGDAREGDEVVTSGLGGVYPEGLVVGRVLRTEIDRSGLYRRAIVAPTADLSGLRDVFVVDAGGGGRRG